MAERRAILLRLPPDVLEAMQRWARDELRSVNAQIEFALREALRQRGRTKEHEAATELKAARKADLAKKPLPSGTLPNPAGSEEKGEPFSAGDAERERWDEG